jgi:signal transduction histidine kinase
VESRGAEVRFRIVPPIYRRWWFLLLSLLVVLAMVAGLYLLRLRRLEREFDAVLAERNRMAREIHDTLTQDFVGASLQLDLIASHLNRGKFELALEQVKRTRQLVTEGLEEARRSIWELRVNHSQDSLPTRLTKVVQRDTFSSIHPKLHVGRRVSGGRSKGGEGTPPNCAGGADERAASCALGGDLRRTALLE